MDWTVDLRQPYKTGLLPILACTGRHCGSQGLNNLMKEAGLREVAELIQGQVAVSGIPGREHSPTPTPLHIHACPLCVTLLAI